MALMILPQGIPHIPLIIQMREFDSTPDFPQLCRFAVPCRADYIFSVSYNSHSKLSRCVSPDPDYQRRVYA